MRHLSNKHKDHPDALFTECAHSGISPRNWIKIGTKAYGKVSAILTSTRILRDIIKLSGDTQTSCLEGFHATLNYWHPKMIHFSWLGSFCRHILASLHFNENVKRETQKDANGKPYYKVSYPKFKLGEEVVREVAVQPTYGYVDEILKLLFSLPLKDLSDMMKKYEVKILAPMNRQFPERTNKEEAIKAKQSRKRIWTELFPPDAEQNSMQTSSEGQQPSATAEPASEPPAKKRVPSCRKCHQPMRGHLAINALCLYMEATQIKRTQPLDICNVDIYS
ncbi:uncharacterized protein [Montipora capricornis]|uniref:uncharacterized protein n=1 Tax=Montipora capricornis TaxID=246305 RepID=UPI0035F21953